MKRLRQGILRAAIAALISSAAIGAAAAQESPAPLDPHVLVITLSSTLIGEPEVHSAGGTDIVRFSVEGTAGGDIEGSFEARVTRVGEGAARAFNPPNFSLPASALLTLTGVEGTIEIALDGVVFFPETGFPDAVTRMSGRVMSVGGVFADLFLADAIYEGRIDIEEIEAAQRPLAETATLTLVPR
jgi:hypothetical protein